MSKFPNIDGLVESIADYFLIKVELLKLNTIEELSGVLSKLISLFLILLVFLFFLGFISTALANFLNVVLQSQYWGHAIVGGVYLLVLLFFYYLLKSGKLKEKIATQIASKKAGQKEKIDKLKDHNEQRTGF